MDNQLSGSVDESLYSRGRGSGSQADGKQAGSSIGDDSSRARQLRGEQAQDQRKQDVANLAPAATGGGAVLSALTGGKGGKLGLVQWLFIGTGGLATLGSIMYALVIVFVVILVTMPIINIIGHLLSYFG